MAEPIQIIGQMLEKDSFSQWAGMKVVSILEGKCVLEMRISEDHLNGFSITHGGILFSLADSALAFAANASGRKAKTISASCNFIASGNLHDNIVAEAKELKSGRNFGFFEVLVRSNENLLLSASFTVAYSNELWK
jgi:acyl-CoA thioesterase